MFVAALAPNFTVAPTAKLVPVSVNVSPPSDVPLLAGLFGAPTDRFVMVGGPVKVKPLVSVPVCASLLVKITLTDVGTVPPKLGSVHVIEVLLFTITLVACSPAPNSTLVTPGCEKFAPVIVIVCAPLLVGPPTAGETLLTVGATFV